MKKKKIVIALGGNALGNSPKEQINLVENASKSIVDLVEMGNDVIIAHGNGPQVGMITSSFDNSEETINTPKIPFAEAGAMSQGYIGYHLQQAISNELRDREISKEAASIITQVVVSKNDKAFDNLTKPIGSFITKEEAEKIMSETNDIYVEDAGRGYRKVVASPEPCEIVELESIKSLSQSSVIVTLGGGGIPVILENNKYRGIDAVIDKDKSSAKLAIDLNADVLLILTAVPKVYLNYGEENERALDTISLDEVNKYIDDKEFAEGSMLPKIEACVDFVSKTGGEAIITSLDNAKEALIKDSGTKIVKKKK